MLRSTPTTTIADWRAGEQPQPTAAGWADLWTRVHDRLGSRAPADLLLVLLLGVAAAGIDLQRIRETSLWLDEAFSVDLVLKPFPVVWHYIWGTEANMTLYYIVLGGWLHLVGMIGIPIDELVVRLPSIAFAILSVGLVFLLGRRFWGRMVGFLGAALYLLNYEQLMEGTQARAYSLQLLLICAGWYALLNAINQKRRRAVWFGGYVLAMTLAVYAHLFSLLLLASQLIAFALMVTVPWAQRDRLRRSIWAFIGSVGLISVLILPILIDAGVHGANHSWVAPVTVGALVRFASGIAGANPLYAVLIVLAAGLAVRRAMDARSVAPMSLPAARGSQTIGTIALLSWATVPVILTAMVSLPTFNLHLFYNRYLVVVTPAVCLLVAVGVASLRLRRARVALAAALLVMALPALQHYYSRVVREDFSGAARWITSQYRPGDGVACGSLGCTYAMDYYLPGQFKGDAPGKLSWPDNGVGPTDPVAFAAYAQRQSRLFFVVGAIGPLPQVDADLAYLNAHYHLVSTLMTAPGAGSSAVRVWLYDTR